MRFSFNIALEVAGSERSSSHGAGSSRLTRALPAYRLLTLLVVLALSLVGTGLLQERDYWGYRRAGGQMRYALGVLTANNLLTTSAITAALLQHPSSAPTWLEFIVTGVLAGACLALGILRILWSDPALATVFFILFAVESVYGIVVLIKAVWRHSEGKRPWTRSVHELDYDTGAIRLTDEEGQRCSVATPSVQPAQSA